MASEAVKRAVKKYQDRTRIQKPVNFNRDNPEEMELLEWAEKQGAWQTYIKDLIRRDMNLTRNDGNAD